jgi:hypothetical protein
MGVMKEEERILGEEHGVSFNNAVITLLLQEKVEYIL